MTRDRHKEPVDVVATIRRSIETSPKKTRRMHLRNLGDLLGYDRWTVERKERIQEQFAAQKLVATPTLDKVEADDLVHLSLAPPPLASVSADTGPSPDFFEYLTSLHLETEKEVELHFISPLFHHLGYDDEQEAAGYSFDMTLGSEPDRREADLLYFADSVRDHKSGSPLVLVECKAPTSGPDDGLGQVQAYALFLKPAYYALSNGNNLQLWQYLGGAIINKRMLETSRHHLTSDFDELYGLVNPKAARETRTQTLAKYSSQSTTATSARSPTELAAEGSET